MSRSFIISHEAYYWKHVRPHVAFEQEILVQNRAPDGGVFWEFGLRWHDLKSHGAPSLRVEIFEDAFAAAKASDFYKRLAGMASSNPSPSEAIAVLKACGFEDVTEREWPSTGGE